MIYHFTDESFCIGLIYFIFGLFYFAWADGTGS